VRETVRLLVAALLYYSGLVAVVRRKMQRSGPRLIILNYHRASRGDLRRHMLYLRRHYRVMHLDEALDELYTPSAIQKKSHTARTPVVLTFDDGYCDNYTHAFKYACELQIPITIFLVPGYLASGDYFWWGEGERLVKHARAETTALDGCTYRTHGVPEEQTALTSAIDAHLRYAHSVAERDSFLTAIRSELDVPAIKGCVTVDEAINVPLSWSEVLKMHESGWVSYGAHTMHHPVLAYLSDPHEILEEIVASRQILEERLGCTIRSFAYPIGRSEHIGETALRAVQTAGFSWAVTTYRGFASPRSDPYLLERALTDASRHWLLIAAETAGIWSFLAPLWKPFMRKQE
jgi:Predicted xylanase/chitin deacetylase